MDIVLPCYNPSGDWAHELKIAYDKLVGELPEAAIRFILVNDGSSRPPDEVSIAALSKEIPNFYYLSYEVNRGKGFGLRKGVGESDAPFCIYTDMDFPYRLTDVAEVFRLLNDDKGDIVIGVKSEEYYQHVPWSRIQISKILQFLTRTFLRISITDTQCGLKGFNRAGREVFLKTSIDRYLCDLEFVFLADRESDIHMIPMPIELREGVEFSKIGWKTLLVECMNFAGVFMRSFSP